MSSKPLPDNLPKDYYVVMMNRWRTAYKQLSADYIKVQSDLDKTSAQRDGWKNQLSSELEVMEEVVNNLRIERDNWQDTAAQELANVQYYQGLLDQIANHIGEQAFIQDDFGKSESPLRAKLPELVKELVERLKPTDLRFPDPIWNGGKGTI